MLWPMMWTLGQRVKWFVIRRIPALRSEARLSRDPPQLTRVWKAGKPWEIRVVRILRK
jgi:hypothetical protein